MKTDFSKFRDLKGMIGLVIATFFGSGLTPKAPGTAGALAAMPLVYYSHFWTLSTQISFWILLTVIGTWAAALVCQRMNTSDHQPIVIDEVIGVGITAITSGFNLKWLALSFVVFRFFDIVKPPPVRAVDQWSKSTNSYLAKGFGVIADDIVAGFQGLVLIEVLRRFI